MNYCCEQGILNYQSPEVTKKINKLDCIKIKKKIHDKTTISKVRRQTTNWGEKSVQLIIDRGLTGVYTLSSVQLFATPWTVAHQTPLSMGFPRKEY